MLKFNLKNDIKKFAVVSVASLGLLAPSVLTTANVATSSVHADALTSFVNSHDDKGQDNFDNGINDNGSQFQGPYATYTPRHARRHVVRRPARHYIRYHFNYRRPARRHYIRYYYRRPVRHYARRTYRRPVRRHYIRYYYRGYNWRRSVRRLVSQRSATRRDLAHRTWQLHRANRYGWYKWARVVRVLIRNDNYKLSRVQRSINALY